MTILLISGSPSEHSRSAALLDAVKIRLDARGVLVDRVQVRDLSPQALLLADTSHPSIAHALSQVARAQAIVIATPVYKAAYSGVLKVLLDLLPQDAFRDKLVLPLATAGSAHHMLAIDYALRPVLQTLSPKQVLPSVFATDAQVIRLPEGGFLLSDELNQRLDAAAQSLPGSNDRRAPPLASRPQAMPVPFSQVQCCV